MNSEQLLSEHYYGVVDSTEAVSRLRRFILDLAVRGRLVRQDSDDEPAKELMLRIGNEKQKLIRSGAINEQKAYSGQMVETNFLLPDSWEWVALGDVFLYDAGIKTNPKSLDASYWLLELEDIEKDTGRLLKRVKVSERKAKSTKSEFQIEDILYGKLRPYLNKVLVADQDGYSTTEIVSIRPYLSLCSEYCALALRSQEFVSYVTRLGQGTKMPRLRTEDAKVAAFPLPPLAEQHRIVDRVDELMTRCDRLEEKFKEREDHRKRFTKASFASLTDSGMDDGDFRKRGEFVINNFDRLTVDVEQIKSLRRTVLNLAVRGKIVEQDPTDEPAVELLQQISIEKQKLIESGEIRKQDFSIDHISESLFEIPKTWKWVRLCQIGGIIGGGTPRTSDPENFALSGKGVAWITPADLGKLTGLYVDRGQRDISDTGLISSSARLVPAGSILFSCRAPIGYVAISSNPVSTNQGIKTLVPYISGLSKYVAYVLSHFAVDIDASAPGTTYRELSGKLFARVLIPLPPILEQKRIVAKVDKLMALCDRLEEMNQSFSKSKIQFSESLLNIVVNSSSVN